MLFSPQPTRNLPEVAFGFMKPTFPVSENDEVCISNIKFIFSINFILNIKFSIT